MPFVSVTSDVLNGNCYDAVTGLQVFCNSPNAPKYNKPVPDEHGTVRGLRIGFPQNFFFENLDGDVELCVRGAIARLESLGAEIKPVKVPDIAALNAVGRVILLCEASAMLEPHLADRGQFGADGSLFANPGRDDWARLEFLSG